MTKSMRRRLWLAILVAHAAVFFPPAISRAQDASAALSGGVSSQEEGPMEGVLVSANKNGSSITTTVVSDSQGRYSFPKERLAPGRYSVTIRAAGYDLGSSGAVEITAGKTAALDLQLVKTKDLAAQLTSADWLISAPGPQEHRRRLQECTQCHTLERILRTRYNPDQLQKLAFRMSNYYEGTLPERFQLHNPPRKVPRSVLTPEAIEWLSTVNLSSSPQWKFPLKTLPRPKGVATRVIITQYDLPRKFSMPHDVVPDSQGTIWYSDHGQQFLGRLNSRTGEVVEFELPVLKPGFPTGLHFLKIDREDNIWVTMGTQSAFAKFDRKTEKFQIWNLPTGPGRDPNPQSYPILFDYTTVDHKIWAGEFVTKTIERMDLRTGKWDPEMIKPFEELTKSTGMSHTFYDIFPDSQYNIYLTDISSNRIGKIDAKTKKITFYQTPSSANSGPRRGHMDNQDRLWFGENRSDRIAYFDTKTLQFREYELPTPFSAPYDVILDKNGYAWTGGMTTDRVARLNTKTGDIVEYLLPRSTNIRRVEVDNTATPVAFWTGDNHGSSIVRVEPLD